MLESSSKEKGKILFITNCTQSHVNYPIALAKRFLELYGDENEVIFALNKEYTEKVEKLVPKAKFMIYETPEGMFAGSSLVDMIQKLGDTWSEDAVESVRKIGPVLMKNFEGLMSLYPTLTKIVEDVKPDFIIFDHVCSLPVGVDKGIAWANLFSVALNYIGYPTMPPPRSGLKTEYTPENVTEWEEFVDKAYRVGSFKVFKDRVSNFLKEKGLSGIDDQYFVYKFSPYLNIYCYPKELDYQEEEDRQLSGNWLRIESPIMKPFPDTFPVPEKLKNLPGKLIYFSLGSMAAVYKPLMQKMLDVLEQLPHRFIISTGLIGDEYVMKENMYGEKYLNQFAVLQTVDLVISHGGNNTLTESFHFGKPLILVPIFSDQRENSERMVERGLGKKLNIFGPSGKLKQELEDAIELCNSDSIKSAMKNASKRIQNNNGIDRVCEELLKFIRK